MQGSGSDTRGLCGVDSAAAGQEPDALSAGLQATLASPGHLTVTSVANDAPILSNVPSNGGILPGGRVIVSVVRAFTTITSGGQRRTAGASEWWPTLMVPSRITISPTTHLPSFLDTGAAVSQSGILPPGSPGSFGASAPIYLSPLPIWTSQVEVPAGAATVRVRLQLSSVAQASLSLRSIMLASWQGEAFRLASVFAAAEASACAALLPTGQWELVDGACKATDVQPATDASGLTTWDIVLSAGTTRAQLRFQMAIASLSNYLGSFDLVFLDETGHAIGGPLGASWPILGDPNGSFALNMDPRHAETFTPVSSVSACTRSGGGPTVDPGGKIDCYPLIAHTVMCIYDARADAPLTGPPGRSTRHAQGPLERFCHASQLWPRWLVASAPRLVASRDGLSCV